MLTGWGFSAACTAWEMQQGRIVRPSARRFPVLGLLTVRFQHAGVLSKVDQTESACQFFEGIIQTWLRKVHKLTPRLLAVK